MLFHYNYYNEFDIHHIQSLKIYLWNMKVSTKNALPGYKIFLLICGVYSCVDTFLNLLSVTNTYISESYHTFHLLLLDIALEIHCHRQEFQHNALPNISNYQALNWCRWSRMKRLTFECSTIVRSHALLSVQRQIKSPV